MAIVGSDRQREYDRTTGIRNWNSPKHLAIVLLGQLRAEEAVRILGENLTYRVKPLVGGYETQGIAEQFPAARSLAQIGNPAVPAVMEKLRRTAESLQRHLYVWILTQVEGRDVARFRVKKAIKDCGPYTTWKANLEAAIEYFDNEDLDLAPPEEAESTEHK